MKALTNLPFENLEQYEVDKIFSYYETIYFELLELNLNKANGLMSRIAHLFSSEEETYNKYSESSSKLLVINERVSNLLKIRKPSHSSKYLKAFK